MLADELDARDQVAAIPDLDVLLADQLADGRASWPGVDLDGETYLRHLVHAVRERAAESAERVVRTMPAADLYLAAACLAGDQRAIAAFKAALMPQVREVLGRLGGSPALVDETEQRVLEMLFV